jgi:signal transduction histidine kinase
MRNRPQLPKRARPAAQLMQRSRRRKAAGSVRIAKKMIQLQATDSPIEATPEELEAIRGELGTIERMLAVLFGSAYDRGPVSMAARAKAAQIMESHFDEIVEEWCQSVEQTFEDDHALPRPGMANALVRFVAHLRDPDDIRTYIHLRRHCQEGMLSRAKPSQFNVFHIALKQVLLKHVRKRVRGRNMEVVRDTVVAAIDERRLMVCQFYIESRESALRASENKYRSSIDHAPDPMYEIDPETLVVIGANSAALELHRILPYEQDLPLIGQPLCNLTPTEMRPLVQKHIRTVIGNGSDQALDLPIRGHYFDVNSALIPAGSQAFIQMILHDVTQRHEMLDTLLKAERLAAAGTFASGVAHEVNNPMASISSLVQSLLPDEQDAGREQSLRTILSQITRIATTLKDLVNFARPAPAERKMLDLNDMVSETLRLVAYNKRFDGIHVEPALASDLWPAFADQNGIQQVLLNLLFNAADAGECADPRVIRIVTENKHVPSLDGTPRVVMRVIDNGCGIAPENVERVFDPFFTTKPAGSGVGLGLSLCQRIVLNNQGTIRMQSKIGAGTTVAISLPVYTETAAQMTAAAAAK